MQLTPRADKIIRILLRFSPDSPVTIGIISEELGVSDRSVQRELPTVEKWMKHNGFCFVRKRSVGLLIDETPERLKELASRFLRVHLLLTLTNLKPGLQSIS